MFNSPSTLLLIYVFLQPMSYNCLNKYNNNYCIMNRSTFDDNGKYNFALLRA